jgi:ABC-type branched-subunit amino acid transport system substrate-binding protein
MKSSRSIVHRRKLLIGLGALAAAPFEAAFACHEREHPPCRAAALVPISGPNAQNGQQAVAGIRAMGDELQQIDPQSRGHLLIMPFDSASSPARAVEIINETMRGNSPPAAFIVADFVPPPLLSELGARFQIPLVSIFSSPSRGQSEWVCRIAPDAAQVAVGALAYVGTLGLRSNQPINFISTSATEIRSTEFANAVAASGRPTGVRVTLLDPSGRDITPLAAEVPKAVEGSGWIISVPTPALPTIIQLLQRSSAQGPIVVDAGVLDPNLILRAANAPNLVLLSSFAPEVVNQRPLARAIDARVRQIIDRPLTPVAALAATAAQVLAQAVVVADVRGTAYGEATRNALRDISLPASELIVPWAGISFDRRTFQNGAARVVALGLRENRVVTVWPA